MKVLVITSDDLLARTISTFCASVGLPSFGTDSGDDAVSLLQHEHYDAVILGDATIEFTPAATLRKMREAKVTAPIVVVSAISETSHKLKMFGLGADDYVVQPFVGEELVARIQAVIRRSQGHASNVVQVGPITVNLGENSVRVHGKPMHLTRYEKSVLVALMRASGRTVSKWNLFSAVYEGRDEPDTTKILDVYICKIRKKLKSRGVDGMLKTDWGVGYRIEAPPEETAEAA